MKSKDLNSLLNFSRPIEEAWGRKGFSKRREESFVALELENEFKNSLDGLELPSGWKLMNEGSLRYYGYEFVQKRPVPVEKLNLELESLFHHIRSITKETPTNSIRTSTHVHFDVTKYSYLDLINFSCLYWILEEFLSYYCGKTRQGNLFCLRTKDASLLTYLLQNEIKQRRPYNSSAFENTYRYSGLNLNSVSKFGSLEFRMMRGTFSELDILLWVQALDSIKKFALQFPTPKELVKFYNEVPADKLPEIVLGTKIFHGYLPKNTPIEEVIREGFLNVSGILQERDDFDFSKEIEELTKKEEERIKKEEAVYQQIYNNSLSSLVTEVATTIPSASLTSIYLPLQTTNDIIDQMEPTYETHSVEDNPNV